jgi:plastocyanin
MRTRTDVCRSALPRIHLAVISNNRVTPANTQANLCDQLVVTNNDDVTRQITFGKGEDDAAYDGVAERALTKGQSFTITLNRLGNYRFYDHLHRGVEGQFLVLEN